MRKQSKNRNFSLGKKGIQGRQVIPEPFDTKIKQLSYRETRSVKVAKQLAAGAEYGGDDAISNVVMRQNDYEGASVVQSRGPNGAGAEGQQNEMKRTEMNTQMTQLRTRRTSRHHQPALESPKSAAKVDPRAVDEEAPDRWKTHSPNRSRRAINISSNSGKAIKPERSSNDLKQPTLHQNGSNATCQKDSLQKIGLVESQRSEDENNVLKPVSAPNKYFKIKDIKPEDKEKLQRARRARNEMHGLKTIANSISSSQEKEAMMKDLNDMKQLGGELGNQTATATVSDDSKHRLGSQSPRSGQKLQLAMRSSTCNSKGERELAEAVAMGHSAGDYDQKIKEVIISTVSIKPTLYNRELLSNEQCTGQSTAGRNTQVNSKMQHQDDNNLSSGLHGFKSEGKFNSKKLAFSSLSQSSKRGAPRARNFNTRFSLQQQSQKQKQTMSEFRSNPARNASEQVVDDDGILSSDIELDFQETLAEQRNVLTKNKSLIYNKICLEKTYMRKKQLAEAISQEPWKHNHKTREIVQRYNMENKEFNGLQAKEFIQYLNRDPAKRLQNIGFKTTKHAPNVNSLFINAEDQTISPKISIKNQDIQSKDGNLEDRNFSPIEQQRANCNSLNAFGGSKSQTNRPITAPKTSKLNKFRIRKPFQNTMKYKNTGLLKHARNNTLFESLGMSNYDYALQGQTQPSQQAADKQEVKVIEAPKYEYYITPKEARDEIQSLYKQSQEVQQAPAFDNQSDIANNNSAITCKEGAKSVRASQVKKIQEKYPTIVQVHQQNSILEAKKDSVDVSEEHQLLINDKSVQSEAKNRKHKYQIIEGQESEFFTFDNSNIEGIERQLMVTMPTNLAANSPAESSGQVQEQAKATQDCEGGGSRAAPKSHSKVSKQKGQRKSQPDHKKREHDIVINKTGEKTLKAEKSAVMRKSVVRPVTRKNLLAIEQNRLKEEHQHNAPNTSKPTDSKANFLDIVKQSAGTERQPAEATTTDGTIYSQTPFMKATNQKVSITQHEIDKLNCAFARKQRQIGAEAGIMTQEMRLMQKEIRIMNQLCQRIVTASDEYPAIDVGTAIDIELSKGVILFYRMEIKDVPSPLKFEITYFDMEASKSNLDIFVSTTDQSPNYQHHQLRYFQEKLFFIAADKVGDNRSGTTPNEKTNSKLPDNIPNSTSNTVKFFKDKYLYFGITSYTGCSISLTTSQIESRDIINKRKIEEHENKKKEKFEAFGNSQSDFAKRMNENGNYYDQMLKLEHQKHEALRKNKELNETEGFSRFYPDDMTQARKIIEKRKRNVLTTHRKAIIDEENFQKKYQGLFRQDSMRKHKNQTIDKYIAVKRRQYYAAMFIKRQKLVVMMKSMYQTINANIQQVKRTRNSIFVVFMIGIKYKRKLEKRGPDREARQRQEIKQINTFLAQGAWENVQQWSKFILHDFLQRAQCLVLAEKYIEMQQKRNAIGERLKAQYRLRKELIATFRNVVWKQEQSKLQAQLTNGRASTTSRETYVVTDATKKLATKFKDITDDRRNSVLDMYLLMCKRESDRTFMQWYITGCDKAAAQDANYVFPKKYHGYREIIRDYISEIKKLEEFLFKGTEKLLPKKKEEKVRSKQSTNNLAKASKSSKSKELQRQPSTTGSKLDVQKYVGQIQKSVKKINQIPIQKLSQVFKPSILRQLILRSAQLKKNDQTLAALQKECLQINPDEQQDQKSGKAAKE